MFSECQAHPDAALHEPSVMSGIDRRGKQRYTTPLTVIIGNTPYTADDWSFGGIRLRDYCGLLGVPNTVDVRIMVPNETTPSFFRTAAQVIRCHQGDASLALAFTQLDGLAKSCLTRYTYAQA